VALELLQDTSSVTLSLHHLLESQSRRLWAQFGSQSTKDGGSGLEMYVLLLDSGISILCSKINRILVTRDSWVCFGYDFGAAGHRCGPIAPRRYVS